jgi:hypothetical protein
VNSPRKGRDREREGIGLKVRNVGTGLRPSTGSASRARKATSRPSSGSRVRKAATGSRTSTGSASRARKAASWPSTNGGVEGGDGFGVGVEAGSGGVIGVEGGIRVCGVRENRAASRRHGEIHRD